MHEQLKGRVEGSWWNLIERNTVKNKKFTELETLAEFISF